ncbi:hypothetical protein [Limimaricola litoreus]|uniref:Uncharacterized protein n=1 Tax=Limimaricola litoreus TaxID=2955316 RepID=A0A9X2FQK8_9RHOB|nr:hypothetical protein [Limimaricola litoreus]MCP1169987.1 hypothetical protein [Limimaricola litoreus]
MPRMTRMLPVLALLPLLAACEELTTVAVEQPAPVFPAPAPAPAPTPAPEPSARLSTPAPVASAPIASAAPTPAPAAPAPGPEAVVASAPQENVSAPAVVLDALLPGTPPSAVFQNGDGCYLFSIERTEPLSGYPVRDSAGAPLCENDDGTVGPRPAS